MKNFRWHGLYALLIAGLWSIISCTNANTDKKNGSDTTTKAEADSATTANLRDPSTAFPQPPVTGAIEDSTMNDTVFIEKAIRGNRAEIAMANLALQKSTSKEIKMIADHLKKDHTQFLVQLNRLKGGGTDTDTALATEAQQQIDSLQKQPADRFNETWINGMIQKHDKTIKDYKDRLTRTKNSNLKNFLTATLPKVEEHKRSLQSLKKKP